jgi:hypothetical protein
MSIISANIKRQEGYEERRKEWIGFHLNNLLNQIKGDFEQVAFELNSNLGNCGFESLNDRAYFYWKPLEDCHAEVADYLIDYFKEKCLELNYYLYQGADKVNERFGNSIMQRQYYLKPLFRIKPNMKDQTHYGNIMVSFQKPDDKFTFMLKIEAFYYANDNHLKFESFMHSMFL